MTKDSKGEYFLSAYLVQPGENSVLSHRHDPGVALWRSSEHAVELVRVWQIERLSGQKHHDWPLFTIERAEAFLNYLLEPEGLSLNDIACLWGTPGLPRYRHVPAPEERRTFLPTAWLICSAECMLEVARLRKGMRGKVPAIVHFDESARLQALDPGIDLRLNDALGAFWRATGIPMLCNTSLNDKSETNSRYSCRSPGVLPVKGGLRSFIWAGGELTFVFKMNVGASCRLCLEPAMGGGSLRARKPVVTSSGTDGLSAATARRQCLCFPSCQGFEIPPG